MKKEKWIVYGLIGIFCLTIGTFLSVMIYADYIYPSQFKEKFCSKDLENQEMNLEDLYKFWISSRVSRHQMFIKRSQSSEAKSLDTPTGMLLLQQSVQSSDPILISAELGMVKTQSCVIHYQDGRILKVYRVPEEVVDSAF